MEWFYPWLRCPVCICETRQLLDRLPRSAFSEGDRLCDLGGDLSFDNSQVLRMNHVIGLEPALKRQDRVPVPPCVDLRLVAIELAVEHRMGAEPVGAAFEEIGFPARAHRVTGTTRSRLDGE